MKAHQRLMCAVGALLLAAAAVAAAQEASPAAATAEATAAVAAAPGVPAGPAAEAAPAETAAAPKAGPAAKPPAEALKHLLALLGRHGLSVPDEQLDLALVGAVVHAADPGGAVVDTAAHKRRSDRRAGRVRGIGLQLVATNAQVVISEVLPETPAAGSGIRAGDLLESIEGRFVSGHALGELQGWIRATTNDVVTLDVMRPGEKEKRSFKLQPAPVPLDAVRSAETWPRKLAYLGVRGLYPGSGPEIVKQLRAWARDGRAGLVLDLRGADGADAADAAAVASAVVRGTNELFRFEPLAGGAPARGERGATEPLGVAVMILVDGETSGAAEVLAAAVRNGGGGAMVVGQPTAGDPLVREAIELDAGEYLYVRTRRLVLPDGTVYDGNEPVAPHLAVRPATGATAEEYVPERSLNPLRKELPQEKTDKELRDRIAGDPALQRAVDILLGLQALDGRHAAAAAQ